MNKIYQRIDWENYPSSATPLNEDNLNKMDYAIDKLDDRIVTHETTKLDTATGNNLVKNVTFTERTGVFTIEKLNGSKFTINTALEKISINFYFDPTTQKLALTLIDGTVQEIDLSALITQYEFLESDTITFEIDASGKVKANILNGSITGEKLEPNYLANVTLQAKNAKTSADNAKTSEELAYQYAEEAKESASQTAKSDAKNITYDNTESGLSATNVKDALDEVAQGSVSEIATDTTITDSTNAPFIYGKFKGYTIQNGEPTPDNPVEINGLAKNGAISVKTTGKCIFGGLTFAQALVGSGSSNVVLDADAKTVQYGHNINYADAEKSIIFDNFKKDTQYTIILNGKNVSMASGNTDLNFNMSVKYTDGTGGMIGKANFTKGDYFEYRYITTNGKTVEKIVYNFADVDVNILYYEKCGIFEGAITLDEFTPYQGETTATIPTDAPLYEGDYLEVYADGSGKLVRAMAEVALDGSEPWIYWTNNSTANFLYTTLASLGCMDAASDNSRVCAYSSHFKGVERNNLASSFEQIAPTAIGDEQESYLYFNTQVATSAAEWKTWLQSNSVTVVYELAEPTEIELTAEQVAEFQKLYTFEPVTNVFCEGETEIQYYKNTDSGETVAMVSKKANNSVSKSSIANNLTTTTEGMVLDATQGKALDDKISTLNYSLENRLSKSLVSTETINIDSLFLSSGGLSTIVSEEIHKSGYTLVSAKFFLRGSYAENIIASFTISGSNTKIYNFVFYNPSDYDISAYGYVDLIYVANSL